MSSLFLKLAESLFGIQSHGLLSVPSVGSTLDSLSPSNNFCICIPFPYSLWSNAWCLKFGDVHAQIAAHLAFLGSHFLVFTYIQAVCFRSHLLHGALHNATHQLLSCCLYTHFFFLIDRAVTFQKRSIHLFQTETRDIPPAAPLPRWPTQPRLSLV